MQDFSRQSIFGHSMGGHGALTMYLKNVDSSNPYLAASAFAPISNPTKAPWGEKAFKGYLSGGIDEGKAHDATELITKVKGKVSILIDYVSTASFSLICRDRGIHVISRVAEINSTNKSNYFLRISLTRRRRRDMDLMKLQLDSKLITIIAITLQAASPYFWIPH